MAALYTLAGMIILQRNYPLTFFPLRGRNPSPRGGKILILWDTVGLLKSLICWSVPSLGMVMLSRYPGVVEMSPSYEWLIHLGPGRPCLLRPSTLGPLALLIFSAEGAGNPHRVFAASGMIRNPGALCLWWIGSLQRDGKENVWECFGDCVFQTVSSCDDTTKIILPVCS